MCEKQSLSEQKNRTILALLQVLEGITVSEKKRLQGHFDLTVSANSIHVLANYLDKIIIFRLFLDNILVLHQGRCPSWMHHGIQANTLLLIQTTVLTENFGWFCSLYLNKMCFIGLLWPVVWKL